MVSKTRCSFQVLLEKETEQRVLNEEAAMNEILMKHGVHLTISPSRNQGRKNLVRYSVIISIDPEAAGRGAGRKPVQCPLTIDEAIQMEKNGISKEAIAKRMGISIASYYRRRKKYLMDDDASGYAGRKA